MGLWPRPGRGSRWRRLRCAGGVSHSPQVRGCGRGPAEAVAVEGVSRSPQVRGCGRVAGRCWLPPCRPRRPPWKLQFPAGWAGARPPSTWRCSSTPRAWPSCWWASSSTSPSRTCSSTAAAWASSSACCGGSSGTRATWRCRRPSCKTTWGSPRRPRRQAEAGGWPASPAPSAAASRARSPPSGPAASSPARPPRRRRRRRRRPRTSWSWSPPEGPRKEGRKAAPHPEQERVGETVTYGGKQM